MKRKTKTPREQEAADQIEKPKVQQPVVSADLFCEIWNAKATLREAAEALGLAASTCATYADRLRKEGRVLKEFMRGRPRLLKM